MLEHLAKELDFKVNDQHIKSTCTLDLNVVPWSLHLLSTIKVQLKTTLFLTAFKAGLILFSFTHILSDML